MAQNNLGLEVKMESKLKRFSLLAVAVLLASCDTAAPGELSASGIVEATEISVSAEIGGRVTEVLVKEGEQVEVGALLLRIDGRTLETQLQQAEAALQIALGNLDTTRASRGSVEISVIAAEIGLTAAELQFQMTLSLARAQDQPLREQALTRDTPSEFTLPSWYFQSNERIEAAASEVAAAEAALEVERDNLRSVVSEPSNADLAAAEQELVEAQAAFIVVEALMDRRLDSQDRRYVRDFIDDLHSAAEDDLESARLAYERLLSEDASGDVLEARARLAVAEQRLAIALDLLDSLRTGEHALEVQASLLGVRRAEIQLRQVELSIAQADAQLGIAESNVRQAESALVLLQLQIEKLAVTAPIAGVVLTRVAEPGEVIQPGFVILTIAQLDELRITVFLPEDRYGQVSLGDAARVTVDSYADQEFEAFVSRIADQAEFTPRNVQTEQDRRSTVYAVELAVRDPDGMLKPGMPADVVFAP
jgi:multidrug resistance efflux pump